MIGAHPLKNAFVHLPGVGAKSERRLWEQGIRDWSALRESLRATASDPRSALWLSVLEEAERAFASGDLAYFVGALPKDAHWRFLPDRLDEIAYLDIETTGTGMPPSAHSTTITYLFRGEVFQEHDPRRKRQLVEKMQQEASIYCTFFGESFDLPFLRREFGLELEKPHVDLCFWLKRLGHRGGLKRVQKQFAEIPSRLSLDIDGYDAVRLWRLHESGVPGALSTLLAYNAEDTVVLEALLVLAYNLELDRQAQHSGERHAPLALRPMREISAEVSAAVYRRLRSGATETHARF